MKLYQNKSLYISLGIIAFIFFVIFMLNFPFLSWFTGWDNLHPEFNFALNFKRALNAVWQSNQGLGTMGGHGYAATLPHTTILYLLSFIFPTQYLRAIFTFLSLITGTLGIFFLVRKILGSTQEKIRNLSALISGIYYMVNLATVENFYIQLEAFIIHFAVVPWLTIVLLTILEKCNKKNLIIFFIVNIIATAQGFIPPLFFVYMLLLMCILFFYFIVNPTFQSFKKIIFIFIITIVINSYWLLPVTYYSFTHSSTYLNAYNNLSSTEDFILKNKSFGNIHNVIQLKGFILNALDSEDNGKTTTIFSQWNSHLSNPFTILCSYVLFGIICLGIYSIIKYGSKKYSTYALISMFILTFSLLATNTFPFSIVTELFQQIPILKQAFRVAFTKFSISLAFYYALMLGFGVYIILEYIKKHQKIIYLFLSILFILLIFNSLPIFQGYFLYPRTKIQIPNQYFKLMDFFKNQNKNERISNFPQGWHWGWSIYKWGYSGSGFLWYGIEQPIMDRAFDVWGKNNENYYWELSQAIYSDQLSLMDMVLKKYEIAWIVLDKNIIPYPNAKGYVFSETIENYLEASPLYDLMLVIPASEKTKDIKIYRVKNNNSNHIKNFTSSQLLNIGPKYEYTNFDQAYAQFGNYITDEKTSFDVYFPFRTVISNRPLLKPAISIYETKNQLKIFGINYDQKYSHLYDEELAIDKNTLLYSTDNDPNFLNHQPEQCSNNNSNSRFSQSFSKQNSIIFNSYNTGNCYTVVLNALSQRNGYLIQIKSAHIKGKPLQLAIVNQESKKADIEINLSNNTSEETTYVIIPPMKNYGMGYSITFNNDSQGNIETTNELNKINVYPFPFDTIIYRSFVNQSPSQKNNKIYFFNQSYDTDWIAYQIHNSTYLTDLFPFIFGSKITNHVLINNWANGWILDNDQQEICNNQNCKIVVLFWPQYLEYIGFGLLILALLALFKFRPNS